ncbi:MAG TPA: class B sortase [Clostridiales bacterium]|nr:class B sortase [Clostridiales bacterium]
MKWYKLLIASLLAVFFYSAYNIIIYFYDSYKEKAAYDEIRKQFEQQLQLEEEEGRDESSKTVNVKPPAADPVSKLTIMKRYDQLREINKDIIGWISIPGTSINYPVVKSDNNSYYLDHNIYGEKARSGAIFMDYRNNAAAKDRHIIIYGHHMRDGSMFTGLMKYKKQKFFEENSIIRFDTLYEEIEWEIFSVYVTPSDYRYTITEFQSDEDFLEFIEKAKKKSMFKKDIELTKDDQILTLSTCTYEYDDARFVVHARRVRN